MTAGRSSQTLLHFFLIAALGFGVYANSLKGEFLYDDLDLVRDNTLIRHPSDGVRLFTQDTADTDRVRFYFYRPLLLVSYLVDYQLWRSRAAGYHLSGVAIHAATAIALYVFLTLLFGDAFLSLAAALLFVAHPVHTEAVSYISGRADPLAAFWMLISFIGYAKTADSRGRGWWVVLAVIAYLFALLSKEYAMTLLLLIPVYHFTLKKPWKTGLYATLGLLTSGYVFFRMLFLRSPVFHPPHTLTLPQRSIGFFYAVTNYLRLLLAPFDLHMEYGTKVYALSDPQVILGIVLCAGLAALAWWGSRVERLYLFCVAWFFTALLPVSNLYPINATLAEHWLYLPSIGFFVLIANAMRRLAASARLKPWVWIFLAALVAFYSVLTIRQNRTWRHAEDFYKRILVYSPASARIHNNLGAVYKVTKQNDKAIVEFNETLRLKPDTPEAYFNLAYVYAVEGKLDEAVACYQKTIALKPAFAPAYYNLAVIEEARGRLGEAVIHFRKAAEIDPSYELAVQGLARVLKKEKGQAG